MDQRVVLAGDEHRERSEQCLTAAVVEGRLTLEELSDWVGLDHAARTRQELATLTQELPKPPLDHDPIPAVDRHRAFCPRLIRSGPSELPALPIPGAPRLRLNVRGPGGTLSVRRTKSRA